MMPFASTLQFERSMKMMAISNDADNKSPIMKLPFSNQQVKILLFAPAQIRQTFWK